MKRQLRIGALGLAACLTVGGLYYRHRAIQARDERCQRQAVDLVLPIAPHILKGLQRSQNRITRYEKDVLLALTGDERVPFLVLINRYGEVRWFKEASKLGMKFEEFNREYPFPTNSVEEAWIRKTIQIRPVPGQPYYDVSVPFMVHKQVNGLLNFRFRRPA